MLLSLSRSIVGEPLKTVAPLVFCMAPALAAQVHHEEATGTPNAGQANRATAPVFSRRSIQHGPFVSVQVNIDGQGANISGDAANEPSIAIDPTDPTRFVIGWRQFDSVTSSFRTNAWAFTNDGGTSWAFPGSIQRLAFNSDPVIDTDARGKFYYLSYPGGRALSVFWSVDGGQTWAAGRGVAGGDKPWMAIDRSGGIGDGNIYLMWQVLHGPNTFKRSTDGGLSFGPNVSVPLVPSFGTLAVGSNGDLYGVGTAGRTFNTFVLAKSTTAKDPQLPPTFTSQTFSMGGDLLGGGPNPVGLLGQACVATDPTRPNHVYVMCSVDPPGVDPIDFHFVRSTDGGQQFGPSIRINDDQPGPGAWQWFGTMSVSPDGRIDAAWIDTRGSQNSNLGQVYYAFSLDGGITWSANIQVGPEWDSLVGHPNQRKIGDYYDMVSTTDAGHLAYSATYNGEQDVYYVRLGDCNGNRVHDALDIRNGTSADSNQNSLPDECELCQRNLGFGAGLALSICGDDLTGAASRATLEVSGGPGSSPVVFVASPSQAIPPISLPGGAALVPDPRAPGAAVLTGSVTDLQGRFRATLGGGTRLTTTLYVQAAMLAGPSSLLVSDALEVQIGRP